MMLASRKLVESLITVVTVIRPGADAMWIQTLFLWTLDFELFCSNVGFVEVEKIYFSDGVFIAHAIKSHALKLEIEFQGCIIISQYKSCSFRGVPGSTLLSAR